MLFGDPAPPWAQALIGKWGQFVHIDGRTFKGFVLNADWFESNGVRLWFIQEGKARREAEGTPFEPGVCFEFILEGTEIPPPTGLEAWTAKQKEREKQ